MVGKNHASHLSKKYCLREHVRKRSLERFGKVLTTDDQKKMVLMIQQGMGQFVAKESLRVTVWDLFYEGKLYRTCYCKKRKELITVYLPKDQPLRAAV